MSFKELRQETKALFKTSQAHPYLAVIGIYLLTYAVSFVIEMILMAAGMGGKENTGGAVILLAVVLYILFMIFSIWMQLSLSWYYIRISRNERAGASFKMALKALPGYIVYIILYLLLIIAFMIIPAIIAVVLAAAGVYNIIIALFAAIIVIIAVYMSLTFAFSSNCYYDRKEKTIIQTIKSNFEATKGHKLQILKIMLIYYIPVIVIYGAAFGLFAYLAIAVQGDISASYSHMLVGFFCVMLLAFILLAVYVVWMLPNIFTNLSIMYNKITGYTPELEQGEIVAVIEEEK